MISQLVKTEMEELQEDHKGFQITNLESANWAFRKLHAVAEQKAEFEALAQKEIERITEWLKKETDKLESQEMFFKGLLTEYAVKEKQNNPKFKLSSPYGKISFRKQQPKFNYQDDVIMEWAKCSGKLALLRIKEEVDKTALKKLVTIHGPNAVTEDGEIVSGVEIVEQEEALKIEVI